MKVAPARTRATRWGAFTARQRSCADSMSLKAIASPAARAGQTWPAMRPELQRIHIGTFTGPAGTFRQRTDIPKTARDLLTAMNIDAPRKIHELTTTPA